MGNTARGVVIAAPSSGTGKTITTMGLISALRARGFNVAAAKVGPDYIDPRFLAAAAGGPCINLDPWAMSPAQLSARATEHAASADLLIVEGVMGLFDGAAGGGGSTADLAQALDLPVVLVVDASRQAQSIAAVVHGFTTLKEQPRVRGVIATRVASDRHAMMVEGALKELDVCYLGAVRTIDGLKVASRHLGLVQASEQRSLDELIAAARKAVDERISLDAFARLAGVVPSATHVRRLPPLGQRIAVARDVAFGFVYPHQLRDWQMQGAEILPFSPLADEAPDAACDAVFLPGGYPELHGGEIAAAAQFLSGLHAAHARGCFIYGECGGYMVLGEALIDGNGHSHRMAGLLGHVTSFAERKRQLGYRKLETIGDTIFPKQLYGHGFHYSIMTESGADQALFNVWDSADTALGATGGQRGAVMGSYVHVIERPDETF